MKTKTRCAPPVLRWTTLLFFAAITAPFATTPASAQVLPGEIVFLAGSGSQAASLLKADAAGNRSIISKFGVRGNGPDFKTAVGGIAVGPDGMLYLSGQTSAFETSVFRINPTTGDRTIISGPTVGGGPELSGEADLVVAPDGQIFLTSSLTDSIVQVDPITGNRTLVSGPGRGTGPAMTHPFGLTRTPAGDFYSYITSDPSFGDLVYFIDADSGNRTIVSGGPVGSGASFQDIGTDVTLLPDGDLASGAFRRILRIDPATGNRSELSSNTVGSGPEIDFQSFEWLTVDSHGSILGTVVGTGIFRVNPATGDRTLLTGTSVGGGVSVSAYREAVEYVPEPATWTLAVIGIASLWFTRRCKITG
jgi:hypothetical protein